MELWIEKRYDTQEFWDEMDREFDDGDYNPLVILMSGPGTKLAIYINAYLEEEDEYLHPIITLRGDFKQEFKYIGKV